MQHKDVREVLRAHARYVAGKANGHRAIFSGLCIMDFDFSKKDLSRINFKNATLENCIFDGCEMDGIEASGSLFYNCSFRGASLLYADFSKTMITEGDFYDVDLLGAGFYQASIRSAKCLVDAGYPNGWRAVGWRARRGIWVRVGCRTKALAAAKRYWTGKPNRREVVEALKFIEATLTERHKTRNVYI